MGQDENYILISRGFATDKQIIKIIDKLNGKDIKQYKKLATVAGRSYGECIFKATDNIDDFYESVVGYREFKNPTDKKLKELSEFAKRGWNSENKPSILLEFYSEVN